MFLRLDKATREETDASDSFKTKDLSHAKDKGQHGRNPEDMLSSKKDTHLALAGEEKE
jgi:hypothetical protein